MPGEYSDEDDLEEDELDDVSTPIILRKNVLKRILWFVVCCVVAIVGILLISRVGPAEQITTTRDVANVLTGAYYPGAPNSTTVALSESMSGTYGGDDDCKIIITYEAGGNGLTEFATAVTHTQKCRLAYSVNILGFFEDWSFPDTRTTYTTDDPGLPIRSIAFAACRATENEVGMPDCTVVLMDQEYSEG